MLSVITALDQVALTPSLGDSRDARDPRSSAAKARLGALYPMSRSMD